MLSRTPRWSPSSVKAILFDWDGIIADSKLDFSGIRKKYFGGRYAMILEERALLPEDQQLSLDKELVELEMEGARTSKLIPGIEDLLDYVASAGIPWAIVSRNCRSSIIEAAKQCGIELPQIVRSRDDGTSIKPDPRALIETAAALGASSRDTLFIGDLLYDMMGARRAGMRNIIVNSKIDPSWNPWVEVHFTDMLLTAAAFRDRSEYIPWEYKELAAASGTGILDSAFSIKAAVPDDAYPNFSTWLIRAASLGIGEFYVPDMTLSPCIWRQDGLFDTAHLGRTLFDAANDTLIYRYPLVQLSKTPDGSIKMPKNSDDLGAFLDDLLNN